MLSRACAIGTISAVAAVTRGPPASGILHPLPEVLLLAIKANENETHTLVAAHFKHLSGQNEPPPAGMEQSTELFAPETVRKRFLKIVVAIRSGFA